MRFWDRPRHEEIFTPVTRITAVLLSIFFCFSFYPAWAQNILEKELQTQQQRLKNLQHDIETHRKKALEVEQDKHSVLKELKELDRQIISQWKLLRSTKIEWTRKELAIVSTQKEFEGQKKALNELKKQVESRLTALNKMGTIGTLNLLFAAESLPELLSRETYLKFLLNRDEIQRKEYLKRLESLDRMRQKLKREQQELKKAAEEIEKQALALEEKRQARRAFLDELKQQSVRYAQMISELEDASVSLKDVIHRLDQRLRASDESRSYILTPQDEDFALQKGRLSPPVFGKIRRPFVGGSPGRGIVISAPWGSEITAVFDGAVAYSGKLKGYGKVIILDHGNGYLSLVAQACELFKKEGEEVKEGDLIGLSGSGPWIDEGVYFEIRNHGKYEDPLSWINTRGLDLEIP